MPPETRESRPADNQAAQISSPASDTIVASLRPEPLIADPTCPFHGGRLTELSRAPGCWTCTLSWRRARMLGWAGPTGHEGADCCHCQVCGLCKGSGRVCGDCGRCSEHSLDYSSTCTEFTWSKITNRLVEFQEHRYWSAEELRWSA